VRTPPWYVNQESFGGSAAEQVTVYVLIGPESALKPVRYFIAKNRDLTGLMHIPPGGKWTKNAFLGLAAVAGHEDKWDAILS
jgi:hypothetical protein